MAGQIFFGKLCLLLQFRKRSFVKLSARDGTKGFDSLFEETVAYAKVVKVYEHRN